MIILGIECTAHTFGVAVASGDPRTPYSKRSTSILSNSSAKFPSLREGFIPRKLADHHALHFRSVAVEALERAKISPRDLDGVAYSYGPGLGHSLHVGHVAARAFSESLGIPLVGVNHALAHVEVGRFFCGLHDPLVAYVSGGNTQLLVLEGRRGSMRYRVLGETLDIGLGNLLDLVGRDLGLSPPDAVGVLKAAAKGRTMLDLPYSVKGMNLSFAGMLTAARRLRGAAAADLCYSVQETAFSMLCETAEKALVVSKKRQVLLVGGNARNKRLAEMLSLVAAEHKSEFGVPPFDYCGDNGGMIALTGLFQLSSRCGLGRAPSQRVRIDEEKVCWESPAGG
ncbi:MAG: tRNA (adenosine(37)-N6)-threonylcarbamoyltransferase complex transferase subunit TsaD [Candidatus Micrarchaeota archaeon]